jgi:hypothetical protein
LHHEKNLIRNSFEPPVVICFDYQAAELVKNGKNIEIIIPSEGTLTYERGFISNIELEFNKDTEDLLLNAGFRLTDGRNDEIDYAHLNIICMEVTRTIRRSVFYERLYTSADGREHQYWVLIYIIILTVWIASLLNRITNKNMRNTVLMAGILLFGWILARLISYQLWVHTDFRRYLNYTYYLFQLSLPITFMWLAHIIDKNEGKITVPLWIKVYASFMFALIAIIFTNDLHFWMYIFDYTDPNWGNNYRHGIIYPIVQMSWQLSIAAVFIILLFKSKGAIRKKGLIFVLIFFAILIAYQYGYQNKIPIARESDTTMVKAILILLFTESLIKAGLIPVNTMYKKLFVNSTLGMRIVDNSGNTVLASVSKDKNNG